MLEQARWGSDAIISVMINNNSGVGCNNSVISWSNKMIITGVATLTSPRKGCVRFKSLSEVPTYVFVERADACKVLIWFSNFNALILKRLFSGRWRFTDQYFQYMSLFEFKLELDKWCWSQGNWTMREQSFHSQYSHCNRVTRIQALLVPPERVAWLVLSCLLSHLNSDVQQSWDLWQASLPF